MMNRLTPTWAVIESRCTWPATITIVGASERDDVFGVGSALAVAASTEGHRAALLVLDSKVRPRRGNVFDTVTLSSLERGTFDESHIAWRTQYDVLIIAVPQVLSNVLGPQAMRVADGVLVAIAENRRVEGNDRTLSDLLVQLGSTTLGVVHTGNNTVKVTESTFTWPPAFKHRFHLLRRTLRSLVFRT